MKLKVLQRLLEVGVIPVVRVDSRETAFRVAEALLEGGAGTIEITATCHRSPLPAVSGLARGRRNHLG